MRLIAILLIFILLFGCLGEEPTPPVEENKTNETINETEEGPPGIFIVEEQRNQTVEVEKPPEEPEEEPSEELEYTYEPEEQVGIYFISVGDTLLHGDSILIKKGDLDILVDAASEEAGGRVVDFLRSRSIDDIDVLISTNSDHRHYGGMQAVADAYIIEELWWNDDQSNVEYVSVINSVSTETKETRRTWEGYTRELNGMQFEILNPPESERFEDVNNDAMVIRLTEENFTLLITSGIQAGAQGRLINEHADDIKVDVMQAPYYGVGAGTSGIGVFLLTAKPDDIVISGSADDSAPNGGSREPFKRLMTQYGIEWHENYVDGTIRIVTDGQEYDIMGLGS